MFACIGCFARVPDPAQRDEVVEVQQITLIQIERAKKKGLTLEVAQHQKKLKQCEAELHEMDMIEVCRADESREPEVHLQASLLTREQARVHPKRKLLTQVMGDAETVEVGIFVEPIHDGDIWVVCTDGLHSCVTDEELSAMVEHDNPHKSVERLIDLAKERSEGDNITVMVIKVFLRTPS